LIFILLLLLKASFPMTKFSSTMYQVLKFVSGTSVFKSRKTEGELYPLLLIYSPSSRVSH